MSTLIYEVFTYGFHEARAEIDMSVPIPTTIQGNLDALHDWARSLRIEIVQDLKYTRTWKCYACGKPSRELRFNNVSHLHLPQPRFLSYAYHLCNASSSSLCNAAVESLFSMMIAMGGDRPPPRSFSPDEGLLPLAASCGGCRDDSTAKKSLPHCGKCKLIRYCGPQCQKNDWPRHKKTCKYITDVRWVKADTSEN